MSKKASPVLKVIGIKEERGPSEAVRKGGPVDGAAQPNEYQAMGFADPIALTAFQQSQKHAIPGIKPSSKFMSVVDYIRESRKAYQKSRAARQQ